jgi:hypothetical protein
MFIILNAQSSDVYWKMDKLVVVLKNTCTVLRFLKREVGVRKTYLFMYILICINIIQLCILTL